MIYTYAFCAIRYTSRRRTVHPLLNRIVPRLGGQAPAKHQKNMEKKRVIVLYSSNTVVFKAKYSLGSDNNTQK